MLYIVIGCCFAGAVIIIVTSLVIAVCVVSKRRYEKAEKAQAEQADIQTNVSIAHILF